MARRSIALPQISISLLARSVPAIRRPGSDGDHRHAIEHIHMPRRNLQVEDLRLHAHDNPLLLAEVHDRCRPQGRTSPGAGR